jgi:hypothetical protein
MAAYRRRDDGTLEIIRPRPPRRWRGAVSTVAAALCVALVPAAALALYVAMGVPLMLIAVLALCGACVWRALLGGARSEPTPAAPIRLAHTQRRATPAQVRTPIPS